MPFHKMLGGDIPDSVAQPVWLYLLENFISFILLFRSTFCLFLLSDTCTDSPGSYTFDRVFPSSVLIFNKQYLITLPHPKKEIVVVKGLEQELNLPCLRVAINAKFINLQLWFRQAFSLLFPPAFPSSSWLLVLVWLFLYHGCMTAEYVGLGNCSG